MKDEDKSIKGIFVSEVREGGNFKGISGLRYITMFKEVF